MKGCAWFDSLMACSIERSTGCQSLFATHSGVRAEMMPVLTLASRMIEKPMD